MLSTTRKQKQRKNVTRVKKRANELDGKHWIKNSISIWSDISKDGEEQKVGHPAMFPWRLIAKLIETFTHHEQSYVLDPFVGTGSTLIACQKLGKSGIGIDISKQYIKIAKDRLDGLPTQIVKGKVLKQKLIEGSAVDVLNKMRSDTIDFVVTSPPYWNILTQKRSADMKQIRDYLNVDGNLGHIDCYEAYIKALQNIFFKIYKVMKNKSYCILNVMDIRKKHCFFPLHADVLFAFQKIGFILDDIIIWDRRKEYNNLRPLGYPYVFRINKVHEFLLIFKKIENG